MLRRMRILVSLIAVLASMALVLNACELEEDDPETSDTVTPPNDTVDPDTNDTTEPQGQPYRYVRIDDLSTTGTSADAGADIDAIILAKAGGGTFYAESVEGFVHGGGAGDALDPANALNAPKAFSNYPATDYCRVSSVDNLYVSLGGVGGYLIVRMGDKIEANDVLKVLEVGGCSGPGSDGKTYNAVPDEIEVQIAVSGEPTGQWRVLGRGVGPEISFTITAANVPFVPMP